MLAAHTGQHNNDNNNQMLDGQMKTWHRVYSLWVSINESQKQSIFVFLSGMCDSASFCGHKPNEWNGMEWDGINECTINH